MSFLIDGKIEFIHIPKTAGCWIEHVCKPWIKLIGTNHDGGRHTVDRCADVVTFAVARSPYSWLKSCLGYTQKRWVIVERNYPGWFLQTPYREIGMLPSLRVKDQRMNEFLEEYLEELPGEYSRATLQYYANSDRLISFDTLQESFIKLLYRLKCPHANRIEYKAGQTKPLNVSKEKQSEASDELRSALMDAEHEWYEHIERGML